MTEFFSKITVRNLEAPTYSQIINVFKRKFFRKDFFYATAPNRRQGNWFPVSQKTIKSYEKNDIPGVFYIHSWELTPEFMPKIKLPKKDHFITFHNINKAYVRMENLLEKFEFTSFSKFIQANKENLY